MKNCKKCNTVKPLSDFSKNASKKDGLSAECKPCHRVMRKAHYEANKTAEIARTKRNKDKVKADFQEYKKQLYCCLCGENHVAVLQFHHLDPTQKDFEVSLAVLSGVSLEKIKKEIEKCVVLCANCHFKEHYQLSQFGTSLLKP